MVDEALYESILPIPVKLPVVNVVLQYVATDIEYGKLAEIPELNG